MNENTMNLTCEECGCTGEELFELEGRLVCEDCAEQMGYVRCSDCDEWTHEDDARELPNGDFLCEECYENGDWFTCEDCDEVHHVDELVVVNGGTRGEMYICEDCLEGSEYMQCLDCGEWFSTRYLANWSNGEAICDSCWANGSWYICNDCGAILSDVQANYDDDDDCHYCDSCWERRRTVRRGTIHNYSFKPEAEFQYRASEKARDALLTFGLELEVDLGDDRYGLTRELSELNQPIYMKADGSLEEGVEIVTHPCTLAYHSYELRWAEIGRVCKSYGFKSHNTSTCGLHIHIGRDQMGSSYEERQQTAGNIVLLVDALWEELVKFSRRNEENLDRWAARPRTRLTPGVAYTDRELTGYALASRDYGRYQAVNLQNGGTVELRLFRGTLKRRTLIASIQLASNLTKYAMAHTPTECRNAKWADIVAVEQFSELNTYCTERGL